MLPTTGRTSALVALVLVLATGIAHAGGGPSEAGPLHVEAIAYLGKLHKAGAFGPREIANVLDVFAATGRLANPLEQAQGLQARMYRDAVHDYLTDAALDHGQVAAWLRQLVDEATRDGAERVAV